MHERILVPTDGSADADRGARHGVELAVALGSTVHALYVIEEGGNPWMSESMDEQMDQARAYGDRLTGEVAQLAADAGVECVTANKVGPNVYEEINEYVEEEGIDAIVMGAGYRGKIGGLLGSTAERVIRTSTVPVTVLGRSDVE